MIYMKYNRALNSILRISFTLLSIDYEECNGTNGIKGKGKIPDF